MKVQIINQSKHELPSYATEGSAGMDLRANLDAPVTVKPNERALIPTGLRIALPVGYEAQIRPRSGLSLRQGIIAVLGTIDHDYRGEVGIILSNNTGTEYTVNDGDRIAQMVINRVEQAEWGVVHTLDATERGEGGFGHTGTN